MKQSGAKNPIIRSFFGQGMAIGNIRRRGILIIFLLEVGSRPCGKEAISGLPFPPKKKRLWGPAKKPVGISAWAPFWNPVLRNRIYSILTGFFPADGNAQIISKASRATTASALFQT
jgi:hypothetical protein